MNARRVIEAVIKITERCNINCTYCYVFNKGDDSYKVHPPYMNLETVKKLAEFLAQAALEHKTNLVQIDFHGGEPLMMKKQRFVEMCEELINTLSPVVKHRFSLQTNAMLIDDDWIEIFDRYQISIGVSLDGDREINDIQRVDHQGRGTYDSALAGLQKLVKARRDGLIPQLGILSVASPEHSGSDAFRHIAKSLKIADFDFLLPIDPHDSFNTEQVEQYGKFLCEVFDEWIDFNDPEIVVRIIQGARSFFSSGRASTLEAKQARDDGYRIITIASNGDIGPDDSLRSLNLNLFNKHNVHTSTLTDFVNSPEQVALQAAENTIPTLCQDCCWRNICRGGAANGRMINRYSEAAGFNNPSIVCDALKMFYGHVAAYQLKHGLGFDRLQESLIHDEANLDEYKAPCPFGKGQEFMRQTRGTISLSKA